MATVVSPVQLVVAMCLFVVHFRLDTMLRNLLFSTGFATVQTYAYLTVSVIGVPRFGYSTEPVNLKSVGRV